MSSSGLITQNFQNMTKDNKQQKLSDSTETAIAYSTCYAQPLFTRIWAMPNKLTFTIKPIKESLIGVKMNKEELTKKVNMKNKTSKKAQTNPLNKGDVIRCAIKHKGSPIINEGYVREIAQNIVALEIDLESKYCEVVCSFGGSDGTCGVYVGANDRSLHLNDKVERDEPTAIEFTDFVGWDVFACGIGRYTLSVCLTRKEA